MPESRKRPSTPRRNWHAREGAAFPLGATWLPEEEAYNFALYSKHATRVTLLLYGEADLVHPLREISLTHLENKSGRVWHCRVAESSIRSAKYYAYRVDGPRSNGRYDLHAFDPDKILLDPYATSVHFPKTFRRQAAIRPGANDGRAPLSVLSKGEGPPDWQRDAGPIHEHDLVIYEIHVRGLTQSRSSGVAADRRGTYLGVIDKIPYLQELGVTAVELLPVHQFDPQQDNYWGYMTLNFFAPHDGYAADPNNAQNEFREMVQALHQAGIEVILDVVFNHSAEGDHTGPCYSYKGIDNSTYYMTSGNPEQPYENFSGTGNTLHCANRYVSRMILDSLRHWVLDYHIDGFRFDLASVFTRRSDGSVYHSDSPIVSAIRSDPVLGRVRLIAEPWDASGLYQLGASFPGKRWGQWNGRFRDDTRKFVRGDAGMVPDMMCRLYGSDDLFPDDLMNAYHPYQSVNYVTSHDGFTIYDQVSYNERHNWANGEQNHDGHKDNNSWNCGCEGDQDLTPEIAKLRKRQVKNFFALLMLANGTPMFCAGDEFLKTQRGNNNPYNQDNELTWLDWKLLDSNRGMFRFFRLMIAFRKAHPTIARSRYWREEIRWYGVGEQIDKSYESRHLAYCLHGQSQDDVDLYVMINAHEDSREFTIQEYSRGNWRLVLDTDADSPKDIYEAGCEPAAGDSTYSVAGRSVVVLMRAR